MFFVLFQTSFCISNIWSSTFLFQHVCVLAHFCFCTFFVSARFLFWYGFQCVFVFARFLFQYVFFVLVRFFVFARFCFCTFCVFSTFFGLPQFLFQHVFLFQHIFVFVLGFVLFSSILLVYIYFKQNSFEFPIYKKINLLGRKSKLEQL